MKKILKILLKFVIALLGLIVILMFLIFSAKSTVVPDIYASSESGKKALAIKGGYKWNSFYESVVADSVSPEQYVYTNNNILLVSPGEKITFRNSDNPLETYKFYQLEMKYYDESNIENLVPVPDNSKTYADMDYLTINSPDDEGTYIYNFKLSYYNNGEVSYGLKVIVSAEPNYEISELINYKNTQSVDSETIAKILNILPYSKNRQGMIIKTSENYNELVINYEELVVNREELINNVIAIFTLIPDLDTIVYKSNIESYYYTRLEIENRVGRSLDDYSNNIELWKKEVLFKEKVLDEKASRDTIYKAIIADILAEINDSEIDKIFVDTQSFKQSNTLPLTDVDTQEILQYVSSFTDIVYEINYQEYKHKNYEGIMISLVDIKDKVNAVMDDISGDYNIDKENKIDYDLYKDIYICTVIVSDNSRSVLYKYELNYNNDKWNIMEL